MPPALLAKNKDWFISYAANDEALGLKGVELSNATGYSDSKISKLKQQKPHLPARGHADAQ